MKKKPQPKSQNKAQLFAAIGGIGGGVLATIAALFKYDFSVTAQMQQGVGYIVMGLAIGAVGGYFAGKG